jgi:hypothetical protein
MGGALKYIGRPSNIKNVFGFLPPVQPPNFDILGTFRDFRVDSLRIGERGGVSPLRNKPPPPSPLVLIGLAPIRQPHFRELGLRGLGLGRQIRIAGARAGRKAGRYRRQHPLNNTAG